MKGTFNLCSHSLMFCLAHYLLFSYTLKLAVLETSTLAQLLASFITWSPIVGKEVSFFAY